MSTLSTFAKYADFMRYRLASKGNPIERLFQGKGRLTGKNAVDIIDEGVKKINAPKKRAVMRRDPAIQITTTKSAQPEKYKKGGDVTWELPDARNARAKGSKNNKAVLRRDPSTQIVPVKSAQTNQPKKGGALTWALPDARNARAKVGRRNPALPAGEDKKKSNLGLILGLAGGGAALAGGGATAIALANRKKKKASPEAEAKMSSPHGLASFAEVDPFKPQTSNAKKNAAKGTRDKEKQFYAEAFGKADDEGKAAMQKQSGKYLRQRNIENIVDSKDGMGKAYNKGGLKDVGNVTAAVLGNPERNLIASGKKSGNKFVRDLAEGAEGFGRSGYRAGATGARGVLNKVVGRTATGKVARLGAAGLGLSAIGGAMRRKREGE